MALSVGHNLLSLVEEELNAQGHNLVGILTAPGLFEDDWLYLDWTKPARGIFVQIRSWHGTRDQPRGELGEIGGVLSRITKAKLVGENSFEPAPPGTVLSEDDDSMLIQCGDGPLHILRWQPEPIPATA